jgi:solute carrier family 25 phosphate transporter 3
MEPIFPRSDALQGTYYSPMAGIHKPSPYLARTELYSAWSVVDDAKVKAKKIGNEATKEFEKASSKAQATAGKIELYTGKYYAACTFGGLLACVSRPSASQGSRQTIAHWKRQIYPHASIG